MKHFIIATFILSFLFACSTNKIQTSSTITNIADYEEVLLEYQDETNLQEDLTRVEKQIIFWNSKLDLQPTGYTFYDKLASLRDEQFELTGEVDYLEQVDGLYAEAIRLTAANRKSNFLLKRSANAIKLHQFKNALTYAEEAYPLAKEKYGAILMIYDACMELGMYQRAADIMETQRKYNSFDYLARYSKYLDHSGDLDSAIVVMENANTLVKDKNEDLYIWSLASLGDMYGHQGKIEKSYNTYLKVLDLDANNHHVLKGIGYIAYAHDNKLDEAKRVFKTIDSHTKLPDYKLLLADIALLEGSQEVYKKLISDFKSTAEKPAYNSLYNKYLIELYLDDADKKESLVAMAQNEVNQRATPMTYQLLARAKMENGEVTEAAELIKEYVLDKSFEPDLVYNSGLILLKAGDLQNAKVLLEESKDASFELGPIATMNIEESLKIL